MKRIIGVSLIGAGWMALASFAQQPPAPEKKPDAYQTVTVPADAKEVAPQTYKYTDPDGRKWIFKKTPFGVSRFADNGELDRPAPKIEPNPNMTAAAKGDRIYFENPTPFGKQKWSKTKAELNELEQAVVDREMARRGGTLPTAVVEPPVKTPKPVSKTTKSKGESK
ncbi:MAG: hypothetical protein K2X35_14290 [Bryobacteraceae bacterium]|nr:hypothetical protein [Bryobacteraceae bacterium]